MSPSATWTRLLQYLLLVVANISSSNSQTNTTTSTGSYFSTSILRHVCVATDLLETEHCQTQLSYWKPNETNKHLHIYPGSCHTLHVYPYDQFGNLLTFSYNFIQIHVDSASDHLTTYTIPNENIPVQIIVVTASPEFMNDSMFTIIITDLNNNSITSYINVSIKECEYNQYKKVNPLNTALYECIPCHDNEYTIDNGRCETCLDGIKTCNGGLDIVLKRNWFAKVEYNSDINESHLVTSACAPGYCCGDRGGCSFTQTHLCQLHRDSSVRMCGECNDGFSETLSGIGICGKCDNIWHITFIAYVFGCFCLLFVIYKQYSMGKNQRTVSHPLRTYFARTLLFFYQTYGFVTFRTFIKTIQIFTEFVNLILNFGMLNGTCLLPNIGPKSKLYMTLLVPCILMFDVALLYLYIRYRYYYDLKVFKIHMISFYIVCDYIARIIYVELTYALCRLLACTQYEPDGEYVMLYAPNHDCNTVVWYLFAVLVFCIVFIVPAACYYAAKKFRHILVPLSVEGCEWYYAMDLFRRGLLVSIPLLPGFSLTQRATALMMVSATLLVIHVAKMPYRWRVNNYWETFVLFIIFISSSIQLFEEHEEILDIIVISFAWLPMLPVLIMWILSMDIDHWKSFCSSLKRKGYHNVDMVELTQDIKSRERRNTLIRELKPPLTAAETKTTKYVNPSTTSTPSGWKYKFKLIEYLSSKYDDDDEGHHFAKLFRNYRGLTKKKKNMDLVLTFSKELPQNTMIDAFDIGQYLNDHTKIKEYVIAVKEISSYNNNNKQYNIKFQCRWNSDEVEIQIETALMQIFEDNDGLKKDLMRAFKLTGIAPDDVMIIDLKLKGSISIKNKDEWLMNKILERKEKKKNEINQAMGKHPEILGLPLRKFSTTLLVLKIEAWVYNDINYTDNLRKTMKILANHGISGKRIMSLGIEDVKKILEHEFALFMTIDTFSIMFEGLEKHVDDVQDHKNHIKTKNFAEIGELLYSCPLHNLLSCIQLEKIDGQTFIDLYKDKRNDWIKNNTGWNHDEIYHINSVLFRFHSLRKEDIELNLDFGLKQHFSSSTVHYIKQQLSTSKIDLEVLALRIKRGQNINKFSEFVANMIDELKTDNKQKKDNKEAYDIAFDNEDIVKTLYDTIANTFVAQDLEILVNTPRLTSLSSVDETDLIDLNTQRDWVCYNCGNYNFSQYINGKMSTILPQCRLCGIEENDSILMALMNKDTFVMVRDTQKMDEERSIQIRNTISYNFKDHQTLLSIQSLIENILASEREKFDLSCLNRTDNERCPSVMRLVEDMLVYKEWLDALFLKKKKKLKNLLIDITIKVDVKKFVDNDRFKTIFMECAQSNKKISKTQEALDALQNMLDDEKEGMNIDAFLDMQRQQFAQEVVQYTQKVVKLPHAAKLFTLCKERLRTIAHEEEFGNFLSTLDMERIDKDYHHILRVHINEGNRVTIENVFRFFELALHFCDGESEIVNCRSAKRTEKRMNSLESGRITMMTTKSTKKLLDIRQPSIPVIAEEKEETIEDIQHYNDEDDDEHKHEHIHEPEQEKDIWKLKQYYVQSQLDTMHTFLVHTDWKDYIQANLRKNMSKKALHGYTDSTLAALDLNQVEGFIRQKTNESSIEIESPRRSRMRGSVSVRQSISAMMTDHKHTHKFVTETTDKTKYGFGVDHSHIHLKPRFKCLRDELMKNSLNPISVQNYQNLLTKAIRKHEIAMRDYTNELICKYFKSEYNIIRNEMIGIRHILAIIIYTDMSIFCTAFRATYRKIKETEREDQITRRHIQLYWYSRFLFEAVEFFGHEMDEKIKVYHGLNKVLKFERFTAYFCQPISSTTSFVTAQRFSGGVGVILKLKCGSMSTSIKPKYLSVSWLSVFPNEDEKLFYGDNVFFEICDIIEAKSNKSHDKELVMLNKFQKMVKNQRIKWRTSGPKSGDDKESKMLSDLVNLITDQCETGPQIVTRMDTEEEEKYNSHKYTISTVKGFYTTAYGQSLFKYFCNNANRKWICIKNFKSLPSQLKNALFIEQRQVSTYSRLSLIPLLRLFGFLQYIVLNDLHIKQLTEEALEYIAAVMHVVQRLHTNRLGKIGKHLQKIEFQSTPQFDGKQNSPLRKLASTHLENFKKVDWLIKYEFRLESTHCLVFTNEKYGNDKPKAEEKRSDAKYDHVTDEFHSVEPS